MKLAEVLQVLKPTPFKMWFCVTHEVNGDMVSTTTEDILKTNYGHSIAIYYSLDTETYVVANCHGVGAQLDTLDQIYKVDEIVHMFEFDITREQRLAFCKKVVELDGIDYSETNILSMLVGKIFGLAKAPFMKGDKDLICSRYVDVLGPPICIGRASNVVGKGPFMIDPSDNVFFWRSLTEALSAHKDRCRQLF